MFLAIKVENRQLKSKTGIKKTRELAGAPSSAKSKTTAVGGHPEREPSLSKCTVLRARVDARRRRVAPTWMRSFKPGLANDR